MHSFKRRRETFAGGYIDIDKKQGRLTHNGSTVKRVLFFKVVSIAMAIAMIGTTATTVLPALLPKDTAQAATYTFHSPTITVAKPVNFINGGFEQFNGTAISGIALGTYYYQSQVPGWKTYPIDASNVGAQYWDVIQIGNNVLVNYWPTPAVGNYYAEMCSHYNSRLNQTVTTTPYSKVYWQFAHKAFILGTTSNDYDVIDFYLRKGGANGSVAPTANEIKTTASTNLNGTSNSTATQLKGAVVVSNEGNKGWAYYRGTTTIPAGQTSTEFGWQVNSAIVAGGLNGNFLDDIKFQTGASLIIEKGISNSSGTRIDGGYGEYSDVISIKIKVTNWGETDAAPCVMNDTLWDGLKFVSGTVTNPDGTTTSNVSCDTSGKVTAYIGTGATASAGGTLKGSQSMDTSGTTGKGEQTTVTIRAKITGAPGSTIYDQASVNYNDKGFESYNPTGGLTSYSLVDYQMDDANDLGVTGKSGHYTMNILNPDGSTAVGYSNVDLNVQDTYVNRFTVINRELDGTVWNDANENGNIDTDETRLGDKAVKMQKTTDGGTTWTDAADWSGTALSTTTNESGYYEFNGILSGQYRVLAEISEGDRVVNKKSSALPTEVVTTTGTQGSYDNDAQIGTVTDSGKTWAVVQTLDKTSQAYTPTANTYYTHNADIGIVPIITLNKGSKVTSSGSTDTGTQTSPVSTIYGDTITYYLTFSNSSVSEIPSGILTLTDTLPDGLTYVSSALEDTAITPTQSGQKLTWSNINAPLWAGDSLTITVIAKVNAPNKDFANTATLIEPDGTTTDSNTTYHHSYGLDLTITKTVAGDVGDLSKDFKFGIIPGYQQDSLLNGLQTTSSSYTGGSTVSGVAAPSNGTMNFAEANQFTLRHGQSITIHDLPMGINYVMSEIDNDGYTVTATTTNETTTPGTANISGYAANYDRAMGVLNFNSAKVDYVNTKNSVPMTGIDTGNNNWLLPTGIVLLAVMAAGFTTLIVKHNKRKSYWIG